MKNKKTKKESRIDKLFEIPKEVYTDEPRITNLGFSKVLIENYKMIMEYQEFFIRIATKLGLININGFNLKLSEMTPDELLITGKIDSIDLEETE